MPTVGSVARSGGGFRKRAPAALACSLAGAALLSACNAILGLDSPVIVEAGAPDASSDGFHPDATLDGDAAHADGLSPFDSGLLPDGSPSDAPTACDGGGMLGDPDNCGSCGHSCLGGLCGPGQLCQPFVLAHSASTKPSGLAIDMSGNVFWVNHVQGGALEACPARTNPPSSATCADGGVVTLGSNFPTMTSIPDQLTITPGSEALVWNFNMPGGGGVAGCSPMSGCVAFGLWGSAPSATSGIAANSSLVFTATAGQILSCKTMECADGGPLGSEPAAIAGTPMQLTLQGNLLLWTVTNLVQSCDLSTNCMVANTLASVASPSLSGIASDTMNVYFTDSSPFGDVYSCGPLPMGCGTSPIPIALNELQPGPLVVDATYAYWITTGTGGNKVRRGLLTGGAPPVTLYPTPNLLSAIAVDSWAVYWTEQSTSQGTIWKLAK